MNMNIDVISRASTSQQTYVFPNEIPVSDIKWLLWTYAQDGRVVHDKLIDDVTLDPETNSAQFTFTQEETNRFLANKMCDVMMRAGIGSTAYVSKEYHIRITGVHDDRVME